MNEQQTAGTLISIEEFCDLCESDQAVIENVGTFTTCRLCDHPTYGNAVIVQSAGDSDCIMIKL